MTESSETDSIISKYPDKIPLIIEATNNAPKMQKKKFLVPTNLTVGQLIFIIRKRVKLDKSESIFIFIDRSFIGTQSLMDELYNKHKGKDGFLHVKYSLQNTFG